MKEVLELALETLQLALRSHDVMLLSDPPQDAWKTRQVDSKCREAIKALEESLNNLKDTHEHN